MPSTSPDPLPLLPFPLVSPLHHDAEPPATQYWAVVTRELAMSGRYPYARTVMQPGVEMTMSKVGMSAALSARTKVAVDDVTGSVPSTVKNSVAPAVGTVMVTSISLPSVVDDEPGVNTGAATCGRQVAGTMMGDPVATHVPPLALDQYASCRVGEPASTPRSIMVSRRLPTVTVRVNANGVSVRRIWNSRVTLDGRVRSLYRKRTTTEQVGLRAPANRANAPNCRVSHWLSMGLSVTLTHVPLAPVALRPTRYTAVAVKLSMVPGLVAHVATDTLPHPDSHRGAV
jgi:hypothetical protein